MSYTGITDTGNVPGIQMNITSTDTTAHHVHHQTHLHSHMHTRYTPAHLHPHALYTHLHMHRNTPSRTTNLESTQHTLTSSTSSTAPHTTTRTTPSLISHCTCTLTAHTLTHVLTHARALMQDCVLSSKTSSRQQHPKQQCTPSPCAQQLTPRH